jgi:hypothetical protein
VTPLEELQAAHKRLSGLRGPEETWHHIERNGSKIVDDVDEYGGYIAWVDQERDASLIVTLHRTIDAQLAMLAAAIKVHQDIPWADFADIPDHLALARAINGEA